MNRIMGWFLTVVAVVLIAMAVLTQVPGICRDCNRPESIGLSVVLGLWALVAAVCAGAFFEATP